ncbi:MAG: 2-C-methyl-D-erythritol 4-phosphate cytidylyltransferase [Dehalococcoidia bacterium]
MAIDGPAYGIVVAAGRSERMNGVDKVFTELVGRPLVAWALAAFKNTAAIEGVVIVAAPENISRMRDLVVEWRFTNVINVVPGGERRQDSVRAGIEAANGATIVAIHDAARPLVSSDLISEGVALAREAGATICAVPARDTVKEVDGDPPVVRETRDRARVWLAQTPQVFDRTLLLRAHLEATSDATDDASLVEAAGHEVRVYEGDARNIKITTRDDLLIAETLLRRRFEEDGI